MKTLDKKITLVPIALYALLFSILAALVYSKLFSANFISWDDGEVVLNNKDVHQFNLKAFFTGYYVGNYAPLSMIAFAIDWLIFKDNSGGHHAISLLFHVVNSFFVFALVDLIFKDKLKSIFCAIIFCFHPLQVETVAWISAMNNLVYSLFFILGMFYYVRSVLNADRKYYFYALLFFILSVLSKPSAICFPLVLLLLDYLLKAKTDLKHSLVNKIPFFIIALVFGVVTIYSRTESNFINSNHAYAIHERIGYSGYAISQYLCKFFLPVNLSVIYPYPQNKFLSIGIGYILILLFAFVCFKLFRSSQKLLLFGLLFFIVNLILVLQFIPFGQVLTADRYMYLPIIGIAFSLVSVIPFREKSLKLTVIFLILIFGALTFKRTEVWKNSIALYSDILKKYPQSEIALSSLGAEYMLIGENSKALTYLNEAIHSNPDYLKGYYNRGLLFAKNDRFEEALKDLTKATQLKNYPKVYVSRAEVYYTLRDYSKSLSDAQTVLRTEPNNVGANFITANCYADLDQLENALTYYNKCVVLNPNEKTFYFKRAIVLGKKQKFSECLNDLASCTTIDPDFAEAYYWKGVAKINLKQDPCADLQKAASLGYYNANGPLQKYCK